MLNGIGMGSRRRSILIGRGSALSQNSLGAKLPNCFLTAIRFSFVLLLKIVPVQLSVMTIETYLSVKARKEKLKSGRNLVKWRVK